LSNIRTFLFRTDFLNLLTDSYALALALLTDYSLPDFTIAPPPLCVSAASPLSLSLSTKRNKVNLLADFIDTQEPHVHGAPSDELAAESGSCEPDSDD
jgi:hypothetical protein